MAKIDLRQVCKRYTPEGKLVVDHVDISIEDNEFVVFVGPSGCGKTTTLRMIAGLEEITKGEISIDGKVVNQLSPRDRNLSMVFQNYALYPAMSVYENLAFGLKRQKRSKAEIREKVENMAELLELKDLLKRRPGELSGGQRQRVAMGRALIRDTGVLLMDEPLSNLDAKLRVQMRAEILALHEKVKRTVIYVTHDQVEAMTMGDRIAVMYDGIIQQMDQPMKIYNQPKNLFVAGFLGSPSMNFFDVTLKKGDLGLYLALGDVRIKIPEHFRPEQLNRYLGKTLVLGIRPEHFYLAEKENAETVFDTVIDTLEPLGAEMLITGILNGQEFTAKTSVQKELKAGDRVRIGIHPEKIHLFDKETTENISVMS